MEWQQGLAWFFGGAFLANAIPHLCAGVMGRPFQSPFATPPGEGLSSSRVNVAWAFVNLLLAYVLLLHVGAFDLHVPLHAAVFGLGLFAMSMMSAHLFGRFHGGADPRPANEA